MPPKQSQKTEDSSKRTLILFGLLIIAVLVLMFTGGGKKPEDAPSNAAAPAAMPPSASAPASNPVSAASPIPAPQPNGVTALPENTRQAIIDKVSQDSHNCISKVPGVFGNPNATQDQQNSFCFCVADLAIAADPRGNAGRDEWLGLCHVEIFQKNNASQLVRQLVPEHVTDAEIAAIPAEKLALYKDYCLSVAADKAKEYRVEPDVFIKLNENYINSCIMMQARPTTTPAPVQQ